MQVKSRTTETLLLQDAFREQAVVSLVPCLPSCILPPFDHVQKCVLVHCSGTHAALEGIDSDTSQLLHSQGYSSL